MCKTRGATQLADRSSEEHPVDHVDQRGQLLCREVQAIDDGSIGEMMREAMHTSCAHDADPWIIARDSGAGCMFGSARAVLLLRHVQPGDYTRTVSPCPSPARPRPLCREATARGVFHLAAARPRHLFTTLARASSSLWSVLHAPLCSRSVHQRQLRRSPIHHGPRLRPP